MRLVWVRKDGVLERCLSAAEKVRATDFQHAGARQSFEQARSTLRRLLGARLGCLAAELPITITEHGKPETPGCEFNLSHSGDWILLGMTDQAPIGVDVEIVRKRHVREISERFFSEAEQARVGDDPFAMAEVWTAKESFLKAIGLGIRRPLREIDLAAVGYGGWIEFEGVRVRSVWAPEGYAAAMAVVGDGGFAKRL